MSLAKVQEIIDDLALRISRPVAVNDFALDLIAASSQIGSVDRYRTESIMNRHTPPEVVEFLRSRSLLRRTEPFMVDQEVLPGMQARMCIPLVEAGFPIAYIWIVVGDHRLSDAEMVQVRNAARGTLAELIAMRDPDDQLMLDSRRLLAVLSSDPFSAGYAISALVADGLVGDLRKASVVVFEFAHDRSNPSWDRQATFRPVYERARRSWARGALLGLSDGNLVAVCPSANVDGVIAGARSELGNTRGKAPLLAAIGSSRCEDPEQGLRSTFEEARYAAWVAAAVDAVGPQLDYSELGAFVALRQFAVEEASVARLSREAAELRNRDSRVYADTALTLLNCAGDVHDTCTKLSIHRTTLYYRLDRMREMIGDALEIGWKRTSIHLGLLMGELVDAAG